MRIKVFYHRQYCIDFPVTDAELNLEMRKRRTEGRTGPWHGPYILKTV